MFTGKPEPRYVTVDEVAVLLDGLMAEKEEQITANVIKEIRRLIAAGELEL